MAVKAFVFALFILIVSQAHAALRCEQAFVDQVKLDVALETARVYLGGLGVETRMVMFKGLPALQITPIRSASQWNRLADSVQKNYGTKVLFAPRFLIAEQALALWDSETKTVIVSNQSLRLGPGERNNLQEFGHMKSELTKVGSPNIFSGFFDVASDDEELVPNAKYYAQSMELDEVARLAQDFHHLGSELARAEKPSTRNDLLEVATRGLEILNIAQAYAKFNRSVATNMKRNILGSGPLLLADGTFDAQRAYVVGADDMQVSIEEKSNGTLRFRLQTNDRTSEIWISANSTWHELLPRLHTNEESAHALFQTEFQHLVQEWEKKSTPSLTALRNASTAILDGAKTKTSRELSELAFVPRRIVAPHLRRTSP